MHTGSHMKGAFSKLDETKEERIYQGKKKKSQTEGKGEKKKRPREKNNDMGSSEEKKKTSKYVKYYLFLPLSASYCH